MDHNDGVVLETERLIFRQHVLADLDAFCTMEADPDFRRYVGGRPRPREEAERRFMEGALKPAPNRMAMWASVLKSTGQYIGRCGVYPHFNDEGGVYEGEGAIGLYIATEYWGRGYATEAGRAFVKFGFDELKLNRIVTAIDSRNEVSVYVIEKLGFELVRTEVGEYRSFHHYSLEKEGQGPKAGTGTKRAKDSI
jgi:ribosomal-protein-alanine N-acetyltransferase